MVKRILGLSLAVVVIFTINSVSFAMMGMCGIEDKDHSGHKQLAQADTGKTAQEAGNKICPVSGGDVESMAKATYEHEGKVYNFCCPGCIDEFKTNPEKYVKKLEEYEGIE